MIAGVAFGALGFVVLVATWSRFGPGRSQRRSVEEHQRALDVLGEVAKRRDGIAQVHTPSPEEIGRAHVHQTENAVPRFRVPGRETGLGSRSRVRVVAPSGPKPVKLPLFDDAPAQGERERPSGEDHRRGLESPSPSVADDDTAGIDHLVRFDAFGDADVPKSSPFSHPFEDQAPLETEAPSTNDEDVVGGSKKPGGPRPTGLLATPRALRAAYAGNPFLLRRVASVAAIAIVLAAVGVGSWQLSSGRRPSALSPNSTRHSSHHASGSHHSHRGSSSTVSHEISPTSTSPGIVTFPLSASSFTITFSATAPCWIG
ncbi:MAG: hypothetical protein WCF24_04595, partial [Acidimicrobiales bacterium]